MPQPGVTGDSEPRGGLEKDKAEAGGKLIMRAYAVMVKSITEILVDLDIYLKSFHDSYLFSKTITVKTV